MLKGKAPGVLSKIEYKATVERWLAYLEFESSETRSYVTVNHHLQKTKRQRQILGVYLKGCKEGDHGDDYNKKLEEKTVHRLQTSTTQLKLH